jgi:hypothetical protein
LGVLVVLGLFAVAGCHSTQPSPPASPAPSAPPTTASATPAPFEVVPSGASAQQAAVIAYRNMWHAFVQAGRTSNPDDPNLAKYATGDALTLIVHALTQDRDQHKVSLGDVALNPSVVGFRPPGNPTEVTIADCADDSQWLVYKDTGGLFNDVPGGRHKVSATVELVGSTWTVKSFTAQAVGTC